MSPKFTRHFQDALLKIPSKSFLLPIRGYHPLRHYFSEDFKSQKRSKRWSYNTTFLLHYCNRFGLPFSVFTRCYSQNPNWFLFLRVLRRFNSPRCFSSRSTMVKSHSEILGSKAACAYPKLIAACHVLLQ